MASEDGQRQLAATWKTARGDTLSPWSQAKAQVLKRAREIARAGGQTRGRDPWIAECSRVGGVADKAAVPAVNWATSRDDG